MPDANRGHFNREPMLWLAVCFGLGIVAGKLLTIDIWTAAIACAIFAIFAVIFRSSTAGTALVAMAFAAAGLVAFQAEENGVRPDRLKVLYDNGRVNSGSPVEIEGVLAGRPEASVDGKFATVRAETLRYRGSDLIVSGSVRVFVPGSEISNSPGPGGQTVTSDLKYGSRVRIACRIERQDEHLNPGVITRREMLDRIGVDATCSLKSPLLIEHLADESVFVPLAFVYDQRANLIDDFRDNLSGKAAGVMIASLLGNKYFLDKDTADLFRDGGTFHILVISGLHITFIGGILLLLMRRVTRNRWLQFAVSAGVLWAYTLAVGADVPVVRAAIMFTVMLIGYATYRPGSMLNSLGICGLILLVWRPSDLFNPSFQLTFVSVAAIVAGAYPLVEHLRKIGSWSPSSTTPFPANVPQWLKSFSEMIYWNAEAHAAEAKRQIWTANLFKRPLLRGSVRGIFQRLVRYIFEGLLVSLIVQLWMLPLTVIYFHRVSPASIFLNLWVGLLIVVESFAAVAGLIAGKITSLLARGFYAIADAINWLILTLPRLISDGGWASYRLPAYSEWGFAIYLLYFLPILLFAVGARIWDPFAIKGPPRALRFPIVAGVSSALMLLISLIVLHPFSTSAPDGRLHIDFLDVGQGDAALITFPDGRTLLVDGGGRINYRRTDEDADKFEPDTRGIGEAVVSEVLWAKGHSRIDHILATHADADHIQGLTDVAKNFTIGSAVFGRTPPSDLDYFELASVLERRGIPSETVRRGDILRFGEASFEVLYPPFTEEIAAVSDNDHSVVVRVVFGSRAFLLTGDVESTAETALLSGGILTADVVKVAHHGSRTSSAQNFIDAAQAKYAVISVGRSSPFGHPHVDVVERWKASGADVITTGERGMISVSTDGRDLEIRTFIP